MPLVYQQNINPVTKVGVWHIAEPEDFFAQQVQVQRTITHPHKRLQHLAGRLLLKELFPDFPYHLIEIADTKKPFLKNEAYHFSISHCADYAAVMVSKDYRVGVDVELVNNKVGLIKNKFLTPRELSIIDDNSVDDHYDWLLTVAWSIKESLFKWYGHGQIDFKEHLVIEAMTLEGDTGFANCRLMKAEPVSLIVHFLKFNDNCLSWVLS